MASTSEAKLRRMEEAAFARTLKRARETNALSVAALRAASARAILLDELRTQQAGGQSFREENGAALAALQVNRASRAGVMLPLYYASLYVVVEGWQRTDQTEPGLSDVRVDQLLASPFVELLRRFRHSMMHPNPLDDVRAIEFAAAHSELSQWAAELTSEFLRFFRDWRKSVAAPLIDRAQNA